VHFIVSSYYESFKGKTAKTQYFRSLLRKSILLLIFSIVATLIIESKSTKIINSDRLKQFEANVFKNRRNLIPNQVENQKGFYADSLMREGSLALLLTTLLQFVKKMSSLRIIVVSL
jgi:hypothetical protein